MLSGKLIKCLKDLNDLNPLRKFSPAILLVFSPYENSKLKLPKAWVPPTVVKPLSIALPYKDPYKYSA